MGLYDGIGCNRTGLNLITQEVPSTSIFLCTDLEKRLYIYVYLFNPRSRFMDRSSIEVNGVMLMYTSLGCDLFNIGTYNCLILDTLEMMCSQ